MTKKQEKIRRLISERKGLLLAHYYVRPEIQEIADVLGDSLALSQAAARSEARVIVFAGVHFMAQSAAILCPEKMILFPREDAGCPLADMATPQAVAAMRNQHPDAVFVTYINSTADVKAACDICCTSSNAIQVTASIPAAKSIVMLPDGNLARYTAKRTGRDIVAWDGCCPVHQALSVEMVLEQKNRHPRAAFSAHPECRPDVLALADFVGSTSAILQFARKTQAQEIIIGTEEGILTELQKRVPDKTFILASPELHCVDMKKITLDDIERSLETLQPRITVSGDVRFAARRALDAMLAIP